MTEKIKKLWSIVWDEESGPFWEWVLAISCIIFVCVLAYTIITLVDSAQ